jgi:hypothetical protein
MPPSGNLVMEKLKVRTVVGWRARETNVRDIRTRMRASTSMKAVTERTATHAKKK